MQKFKTLDDMIALAEFAHRNQQDQAGEPYINHPLRVLKAVQAKGARPYVQMAAVLHDVTEDTAFTCDMLLQLGVPEAAVRLVRLVDRDASAVLFHQANAGRDVGGTIKGRVWYFALGPDAQDEFYYAQIRENDDALLLKDCDIDDNSLEWRLSYLTETRQDHLRAKYKKAKSLLHD